MFELGDLAQLPATLAAQPVPAAPASLIDEVAALEIAVHAIRGRQARLAVELALLREAESAPRRELDREERLARMRRQRASVGAELALARRISPYQGRTFLSLARALHAELPAARSAVEAGELTLERAQMIVSGTALLSREHRAEIDAEICADGVGLLGDRELAAQVRLAAVRRDAAGVVEQIRRAEGERRVSLRPGRDSMTHLHAVLPIRDGVACLAALKAASRAVVAAGDAAGEGQAMGDVLVERLTGRAAGSPDPIQLRVVVGLDSLLGERDDATATLGDVSGVVAVDGLPAQLARRRVHDAARAGVPVEIRRLFAAPVSGALVAMESRSRCFPPALAEFIRLRDRWCRTPYCSAPIRHVDHVVRHADGGATSAANGQGLCVGCNQVKEARGWRHRPTETPAVPPGAPAPPIDITSPTGGRHRARPPMSVLAPSLVC